MATVTTIVLAGGMSRRMGQDKASIEVSGVPLLTRTCTVGLSVSDRVYVVAGNDRDYAKLLPSGCEMICDRVLEGPLVALYQATSLQSTMVGDPNWFLVLACDLPNLSASAVQAWVQQLDRLPESTIAYLPKSTKGWEPLCGFYHSRSIPLLHHVVESGGRSFQRWLSQETIVPLVQELGWCDRGVFMNCNTPIDLELAIQRSD